MSKQKVDMQSSRIRRAPPSKPVDLANRVWWDSREWEIASAIAGITFVALGISALVLDLGQLWPS